jgi:hypothetical protein
MFGTARAITGAPHAHQIRKLLLRFFEDVVRRAVDVAVGSFPDKARAGGASASPPITSAIA